MGIHGTHDAVGKVNDLTKGLIPEFWNTFSQLPCCHVHLHHLLSLKYINKELVYGISQYLKYNTIYM